MRTFHSENAMKYLAAFLCAAMMLPCQVMAKPTPPLTMTAAFESASPELNKTETLRVTLTTTMSYANLAVKVALPGEVTLVSGALEWKGALNAGEKREMTLKVMLKNTGRYTIKINAAFDPDESQSFSSATANFNVIASEGGVTASMEDFSTMDLKRAKTPAEQNQLRGLSGIETKTPAPAGTPDPVPPFLQKPADQNEKPAAPAKPQALLGNSISVRVSGVMKYKDSAGTEHPIRFAKIKVLNMNPGGTDEVMGQGNTLADGSYSIACSGGDADSGPDIKVRVYCAIMNDAVASVGDAINTVYYMQSAENTDFAGSTLTVSLTTGTPVPGSTTDDDNARRFSVLDAMLQFAAEACFLRNFSLMPKIPVIMPRSTAFYSNESPESIGILRADCLDWDVIGHEYGHYLAIRGASTDIDNSPGGFHDGNSAIPSRGKEKGVLLAWSEGWATFYEIMAQIKPTQNLFALPGVPNSGDRTYHDTEDANVADDLETFTNTGITGKGQGYACERSISGVLYDICDADVDTSVDGKSKDYVNISVKQLWNILNTGNMDDVGKFYNSLCAIAGYNVATILFFSPVFALNNVGPELSSPAEGTVVSSVVSPQFTWTSNGDPTAGYQHDKFDLIIAKNNFTELIGIKENIADTKYTFTDADWQAIASLANSRGEFEWAVTGYNSINPRMPNASGLGKFVSNVQTFKLKAYHVRLTWDKIGTDVDLHLSPPSGSDCYYGNRNPDWGVAGDPSDDPSLDRDCISSCVEENLTIDKAITPGDYRFWVHYYSDHGQGGTTATVQIYKYGQLIGSSSQYLAETGDSWTVFDFSVGGHPGLEVVAEHPGEIERGVTVLPAKQAEE
ncbi:MAG: hypothetical protein WC299_00670 [Kiritimatiellia bacterium]